MNRVNDQILLEEILQQQALPVPLLKQSAREILTLIREGLIRDGVVNVSNFGSFRLKQVAARRGINPQTRERITIPAHQRVIFTPCKALRELIEPNHQAPIPIEPDRAESPRDCSTRAAPPVVALAGSEAAPVVLPAPQVSQSADDEDASRDGDYELDLGRLHEAEPVQRKHYYRLAVAAAVLFALATAAMFIDLEKEGMQAVAGPDQPTLAVAAPSAERLAASRGEGAEAASADAQSIVVRRGGRDDIYFYSEQRHPLGRGESLWLLAGRHYHAPLLWPHIFQANREAISDPDHIREGVLLLIPALQGSPDALSSADRSNIAEGYYLVYLHYRQQGRSEAFFALLAAKHYDANVVERHRNQLRQHSAEQVM